MLTDEDMAVLAHIVEDTNAWIAHVFEFCATKTPDAQEAKNMALDMLFAKCRRDVHVAAYRAAKDKPDYEALRAVKDEDNPGHAPRGRLPSAATRERVRQAVEARDAAKAAQAAQQERINNLFN